jgi:hypothetical protein
VRATGRSSRAFMTGVMRLGGKPLIVTFGVAAFTAACFAGSVPGMDCVVVVEC